MSTLLPDGVDRRGIVVLSVGHAAADLFQGSVPALLPFLIRDRNYSYGAAATLFLMASLGSSLLQPLLGIYADKVRASWLMPVGLFLAAAGLALVGFAHSYAATAAALLVGGFGVAAFHPEAVRYASYVSAARRGAGISVFAVGGVTGFALGPILTTPVVVALGLSGTPIMGAVIAVAGAAVLVSLRYLERFRPAAGEPLHLPGAAERNEWRPFGLAAGAATGRAVVGFALQTFVPLFFVAELASSEALGNAAVAGMLVASAVGTLVGGHLADRVGFRSVVVWTLALEIPLVFALPYVGVGGAYVLMALIGMVGGANFYPLVVIAQNALPRYLGLAAGVVLGLAIGIGAGIVALLGVLADATSLTVALLVVGGAQVVAFLLAAALPAERRPATAPLQDAVTVPGEA